MAKYDHSLLYTIVEYFMLLRAHGEHAVKLETVALWAGAELGRLELHRREVIAKRDDDLAALALLNRIWRAKSTSNPY